MHKERYCRDISHECHTDTDYHDQFLFSGDSELDADTAETFLSDPDEEFLFEADNHNNSSGFGWR
jgi:hypothetical protein